MLVKGATVVKRRMVSPISTHRSLIYNPSVEFHPHNDTVHGITFNAETGRHLTLHPFWHFIKLLIFNDFLWTRGQVHSINGTFCFGDMGVNYHRHIRYVCELSLLDIFVSSDSPTCNEIPPKQSYDDTCQISRWYEIGAKWFDILISNL